MGIPFLDVPPPPFLQQFLHQQAIVSLFNIGLKMVVLVFDREVVSRIYEILELISDNFENFVFLFLIQVFHRL